MKIREITLNDIDDYTILAKQLGYEIDEKHLINCINDENDAEAVFVADNETKIIGWVDCRISHSYLNKAYCEIVGLIVDENERNKGIGKSLIDRVVIWAKTMGLGRIIVHSNVKRKRAHSFYLKNGWDFIKKSMLFGKDI
ncbi:MAG: GNAT family N-acetyltransferase [Spirochaetales bacterium]|nr:GNAT family N-acetyltransferase [Spirochaetales bacterium]